MNCDLFTKRGLRCPRPVRYGGVLLLVALVVGFAALRPHVSNPGVAPEQPAVTLLLKDLNAHREQAGLPPLQWHPKLTYVASEHANDMVARNYFDHVAPDGTTPFTLMQHAEVHFVWAGENIAESDYAPDAASALWESPEHRSNILNPHYRHVGISARRRPSGAIVFVEEFSN